MVVLYTNKVVNMEIKTRLTKPQIIASLRELGLHAGMGVMVHSSLKSFGYVEGGPLTVIEALMDIITPAGTLMMPSFNHGAAFRPGGPGYYDPTTTPTTNGAIPNTFWQMPDVYRSLNPTHAFAAWGKDAQRYMAEHHHTLTMGPDSPLGLMHKDDGYVLLLGVNYGSNTFHHCVEMSVNAPCLGQRTEAYPMQLPDGRRVIGRTWGWRGGTCPFTDANRYADALAPYHRQVVIGKCTATFYRMADGYRIIERILREGKAGFPGCSGCSVRPRQVAETVPSDWDVEHTCLMADSEALTY